MATFVKERTTYGHCIIRWGYSSQLSVIQQAAAVARADFPWLTDDDIKLERYGGDRIKRMHGIEFVVADIELIPNDYTLIGELHLVL